MSSEKLMQEMILNLCGKVTSMENFLYGKVTSIEKLLKKIDKKLEDSTFSSSSETFSSTNQSESSTEYKMNPPRDQLFLTSTPKSNIKESFSVSESSIEVCQDCKEIFNRDSGDFNIHTKTTGCKPFQCGCGELFKHESSLIAHKSTHSTPVYACECGSIFLCEQYLRNHKRRMHEMDSSDFLNKPIKVPRLSSPQENS